MGSVNCKISGTATAYAWVTKNRQYRKKDCLFLFVQKIKNVREKNSEEFGNIKKLRKDKIRSFFMFVKGGYEKSEEPYFLKRSG